MKTILFIALALFFAAPALADDDHPADKYTVLNLTETASRKVAQDRLQASLIVEEKAMSAAEAQNAVNKKMAAALKTAKGFSTVKTVTGYYQSWQDNSSNVWHARQSAELSSADAKQMLDLVGQLQKAGLQTGGLTYYLSDEAQKSLTDALTDEAIQKLKARADALAKSLGMRVVRFAEITPGFNQPFPAMMMRADAAMAGGAMMAPSAEAGEQNVTISISARIYLQ